MSCVGAALAVGDLTDLAIALLSFLHGAKLSREAVIAAASHWRLHALVPQEPIPCDGKTVMGSETPPNPSGAKRQRRTRANGFF